MPIVLDMVAFVTRTVCYDSCPSVTTVLDILCLLTEGYVTILCVLTEGSVTTVLDMTVSNMTAGGHDCVC